LIHDGEKLKAFSVFLQLHQFGFHFFHQGNQSPLLLLRRQIRKVIRGGFSRSALYQQARPLSDGAKSSKRRASHHLHEGKERKKNGKHRNEEEKKKEKRQVKTGKKGGSQLGADALAGARTQRVTAG